MQEMVYDDTRWVRRLQQMGSWDERQARRKGQEAMLQKIEKKRNTGSNRFSAPAHRDDIHRPVLRQQETLFDAGWEVQTNRLPDNKHNVAQELHAEDLVSGLESSTLASEKGREEMKALHALDQVKSIRGAARQEYGKVHELLQPYYASVVASPSLSTSTVWSVFESPAERATLLAQLRRFSRADTTLGAVERRTHLEAVLKALQEATFQDFQAAHRLKDFDGSMRQCAHVLVTLGAGAAAVEYFVDNSLIIQQKEDFGDPSECLEGCAPGHTDLGPSQRFLLHLAAMLDDESLFIERIFPQAVDVYLPLLRRIEDSIISEYIKTLFKEAYELNVESYLKAVGGIIELFFSFIKSLKPPAGSADGFAQECLLITMRLFEPHADLFLSSNLEIFKDKCLDEVRSWNRRLSDKEASAESFYMSHVSRQAAKQDFLSSFKKVLMMPVTVVSTAAKPDKSPAPAVTDLSTQETAYKGFSQGAPTTELAAQTAIINSKLADIGGLLSLEVSLSLVHMAKAAIERTANFIPLGGRYGGEAKAQCQTVFSELLTILSSQHIQIGFNKAIDALSRYNAREATEHGGAGVRPLVMFLELVNVGDLIQQMVEVFYMQELITPKIVDSDDFLNPTNKGKKRFEQALDESVAAGLSKGIDVLMDEVEYICAITQSTTDFNPDASALSSGRISRDSLVMDIGPTQTSVRVVELLSTHTDMLVGSTDKNMLDVFNQEVGLRLFTVLCKHLKRQRISSQGAIKLISDTNLYFQYVKKLKNKELLQYFTALREMSQIFLVDGAHGKEIATIIADGDRYHGIFRAEEVYEFAERRADWYMIKGNVEKAMYGAGCSLM